MTTKELFNKLNKIKNYKEFEVFFIKNNILFLHRKNYYFNFIFSFESKCFLISSYCPSSPKDNIVKLPSFPDKASNLFIEF